MLVKSGIAYVNMDWPFEKSAHYGNMNPNPLKSLTSEVGSQVDVMLEKLPKELFNIICFLLDMESLRNLMNTSANIRCQVLDNMCTRMPLRFLYDDKRKYHFCSSMIKSHYLVCSIIYEYLECNNYLFQFYKVLHFKNQNSVDVQSNNKKGNIKAIKKYSNTNYKVPCTSRILEMLPKFSNLSYFKFDVSEIKLLLACVARLPQNLKCFHIDVTTPKFYKQHLKGAHVSQLSITCSQLKVIRVNALAAKFCSNSRGRDIREVILSSRSIATERNVQNILLKSAYKHRQTNQALVQLSKLVAQLIHHNKDKLTNIELEGIDAYHIMKYKRALADLKDIRIIKLSLLSAPRLGLWVSRFLVLCTEKRSLFSNFPFKLYPSIVIADIKGTQCWVTTRQSHGEKIHTYKVSGNGTELWKKSVLC